MQCDILQWDTHHDFPWLLIIVAGLSGVIVWVIYTGRIWTNRFNPFQPIERSDDPFSFWTNVALLVFFDGLFLVILWRHVSACLSS